MQLLQVVVPCAAVQITPESWHGASTLLTVQPAQNVSRLYLTGWSATATTPVPRKMPSPDKTGKRVTSLESKTPASFSSVRVRMPRNMQETEHEPPRRHDPELGRFVWISPLIESAIRACAGLVV